LDLGIRDVYLLGAFADFLLDQGRYEEARDLLNGDTRAETLLLRLALAEQPLNSAHRQDRAQQIRAQFAAEWARGDELHLREEARFTLHLLNQPVKALRIALRNWDLQREPADSRIVTEYKQRFSPLTGLTSSSLPIFTVYGRSSLITGGKAFAISGSDLTICSSSWPCCCPR
jgi:hypothetical protein